MRVLLLAMPETADFIDYVTRLPNLALVSLAGNLPGHDVRVLDLVIHRPGIKQALEDVLQDFRPQIVGLSAMTFQFVTLLRVARFIRKSDPAIKIAVGGYHATLMAHEETSGKELEEVDFFIRGEGETIFRELVDELENPVHDFSLIKGLSYRTENGWRHNPDRSLQDLTQVDLPRRDARLDKGFHFLGMPMDVAEISRGCPFNCKFCSITHMYGQTFRRFPLERVIADLKAMRAQGTEAVFFVDDNIVYEIDHFSSLCRAIVEHGLNDMCYMTQVTAVGIAQNPTIAEEMDRANFRIVFVGFESMEPSALKGMRKPTNPEINQKAAKFLRERGIAVIAGCIVGYPDDTSESVKKQFQMIKKLRPDSIYAQYLTPYPKTVVRKEMLDAGFIVNVDNYTTYDGFTCNIRTKYLSKEDLYCVLKRPFNFFVKACFKTAMTNLYNVLCGRQYYRLLDI